MIMIMKIEIMKNVLLMNFYNKIMMMITMKICGVMIMIMIMIMIVDQNDDDILLIINIKKIFY